MKTNCQQRHDWNVAASEDQQDDINTVSNKLNDRERSSYTNKLSDWWKSVDKWAGRQREVSQRDNVCRMPNVWVTACTAAQLYQLPTTLFYWTPRPLGKQYALSKYIYVCIKLWLSLAPCLGCNATELTFSSECTLWKLIRTFVKTRWQ